MITTLGACVGNAHAAAIVHAERFPRWRHPDEDVIARVEHLLGT